MESKFPPRCRYWWPKNLSATDHPTQPMFLAMDIIPMPSGAWDSAEMISLQEAQAREAELVKLLEQADAKIIELDKSWDGHHAYHICSDIRETLARFRGEKKCDYCGEKIPCRNRCHVDMDQSK